MDLQDKVIICHTCGRDFVFTVREQEFYGSKGFSPPRHCGECRAKRKREREAGAGIESAAPQASLPKPRSRDFQVECAACGKPASVPFKPIAGRPVYCRDCFAKIKSGASPQPPNSIPHPKSESSSKSTSPPAPPQNTVHTEHIELDPDLGPLPEVEPAPDEEGEVTQADYIPFPIRLGATPEEVNPTFKEDIKTPTKTA
ncbi:MAG: hypothetical protein FJY65_00410 [Calditrichaeota bacterium]|nr:hypothetical protein [Calditrichota bacterium]